MRVHLQGGFGEKGRTSVLVEDGQTCIMLDAGIMVASGVDDYHPRLARPVSDIDALIVSHAHEDHIGALCWLLQQGYDGPIYMTRETQGEMAGTLRQYARADDLAKVPPETIDVRVIVPGEVLRIGGFEVLTGHSGHVAGGVWMRVSDKGGQSLIYAGDVVPNSAVFPMTPFSTCDLLLLDGSYGADVVSVGERKRRIVNWIDAHPQGCLLPTPLSGRSLELIAVMPGGFALEKTMRAPLMAQLAAPDRLDGEFARSLRLRLETALDWDQAADFLARPLLVHDAMGCAGPAAHAIPRAESQGFPMLFTGHLPDGSPGAMSLQNGSGDWLRLPTHPTLDENRTLWEMAGKPPVFGHSCTLQALAQLQAHIPALKANTQTGQAYDIRQGTT